MSGHYAIVGASASLGYCLTKRLLEAGHHVYITLRTLTPRIVTLEQAYSDRLTVFDADIRDEVTMTNFGATLLNTADTLDAVAVVAGIIADSDRTHKLQEIDVAGLRETLDINTVGPIIAAKTLLPCIKPHGRFLIVTSEGVQLSSVGSWIPAYGLSKTAATKVAGILNASQDTVDCYAVHPGRMNTQMGRTTAQIEPEESAAGFVNLMTGTTPMNRSEWYIDYTGRVLPL